MRFERRKCVATDITAGGSHSNMETGEIKDAGGTKEFSMNGSAELKENEERVEFNFNLNSQWDAFGY